MKGFKFSILLLLAATLLACQPQPEQRFQRLQGHTMGTTYSITLELGEGQNAEVLQNLIDQRLLEINQLMSTYIDDSELSRFNASRSTECQPVSSETRLVVEAAVEVSRLSQGKFDVTLAPLIEIWGFDKKETQGEIPPQAEIERLLGEIGFQKIQLGEQCIAKQNPELSINLSAIAKGYGVDQVASLLETQGIANYLVEIGGEIALKGHNPKGEDWHIAIESAASETRSIQRVISPKGLGVATSGDYRNYFEKNGKRYSHTIDPTSGYPIDHTLASVTVLHPQTMVADALATALMVMGPEQALQFAGDHQLAIFMLVKHQQGFIEVASEAFKPYLDQERAEQGQQAKPTLETQP